MKTSPVTRFVFVFIILTVFGVSSSYSQRLSPGPQDLSFFSAVDDTDQPYAVYIPENFDESKAYPLVVFLHGAWSNHRLGMRRLFGVGNSQGYDFIKPGNIPYETDVEASRYWPPFRPVGYIAAAPLARGTAGYQGVPEQDVYDMIDDLKSRFLIDEDRLYLTGLSMGGGGTLWLGLTRPDIWAAIAPVCPAPPDGSAELAGNACNLPVHLFIGDKDFLYGTAIEWKAKLEATAQRLDYVEYPGVGHNSWEWAYKDGFIFDWFSQFRRDLFPEKVSFTTKWFRYNKAYWVTFDDLVPGEMATIDAKFTGNNRIEVQTSGLGAFTLNLAGHPMFDVAKKVSLIVDGQSFSVRSADAVSFTRTKGSWTNRKFTPGLTAKQPGGEGPISAAVDGSHIYVYGTGGDPSPEELAARRAQAAAAADWMGRGGRIMVFPRVISDQQVRQSDYVTSNLVLFGTRETNAIIEKFADRLPLHLDVDASDCGLLYIYPMNRHYLLINSGLPWWIPPKQAAGQQGLTFMGSRIEMLNKFGDFILFRESPDNVIKEGTFDNEWKLTEPDAAALQSSGVINLR
ncbi:MAG: prolyl oligopeptidase family serine peptidase [Bacteroidales bacterium]|nr:prolyl oligopeptidase family serine peptidase [Bacteroidales bacterium]